MSAVIHPGKVALIGSGETAHIGGLVFDKLASTRKLPVKVGILETPAGFELNSQQVAGRIGQFLTLRLQNYQPIIKLIAARHRHGEYSTSNPALAEEMVDSHILFMGPGSPSYAVRQLEDSLVWKYLVRLHQMGVDLCFASAACIAIGSQALPVYEIYKVGEDPHWKTGLGLLNAFGINLVVVPHWDNADGGSDLDTSRCFMGKSRFDELRKSLSKDNVVLGIDEHTGLIIDFSLGTCSVLGKGAAHVLVQEGEQSFTDGETFPIQMLGNLVWNSFDDELTKGIVSLRNAKIANLEITPDKVMDLVHQRQQARENQAWLKADRLRGEIEAMGWLVQDTSSGPQLIRKTSP